MSGMTVMIMCEGGLPYLARTTTAVKPILFGKGKIFLVQ